MAAHRKPCASDGFSEPGGPCTVREPGGWPLGAFLLLMASASLVASSECRKLRVDEGGVAALAAPSLSHGRKIELS